MSYGQYNTGSGLCPTASAVKASAAAARLRVRKELAESAGVAAMENHHQRERNASGSGKPPLLIRHHIPTNPPAVVDPGEEEAPHVDYYCNDEQEMVAATPAPATLNWRSLAQSTNRTSRRMGRNVTKLKPQRLGAFEEDSSTETMTSGGSGGTATTTTKSVLRDTNFPPHPPPLGGAPASDHAVPDKAPPAKTESRHRTESGTNHQHRPAAARVPLSPVRVSSSAATSNVGNFKPNINDILAKYSMPSPVKKETAVVTTLSPVRIPSLAPGKRDLSPRLTRVSPVRSPVRVAPSCRGRGTKLSSPMSSGLRAVRVPPTTTSAAASRNQQKHHTSHQQQRSRSQRCQSENRPGESRSGSANGRGTVTTSGSSRVQGKATGLTGSSSASSLRAPALGGGDLPMRGAGGTPLESGTAGGGGGVGRLSRKAEAREPEQPQQPEETQEPKYIEDAPPPPVPQLQPTSGPPPTAGLTQPSKATAGLTQPSRVPIATQGGVSQSSAAHQQSVPSTAHSEQAFSEPAAASSLAATPGCNRISINGHCYSVVGTIGSGGSAKVYRALDSTNQLVAIKRVDITDTSEIEAQGFRNEIKLLQKLKGNPRIVTLYDSEEREEENGSKRILYMVMEHGEKDLSRMLKDVIAARLHSASGQAGMSADKDAIRNALTDAKVKFYWEEMLEAVQVIHREGIVHSDLKPANFLIAGGFLKLIDFGIASAVGDDKTHVTKDNLIGTFNFMSPEAIQNENESAEEGISIKINYKSDVWSLGCILYNLIYGKMPFGEIKNPMKKFQAILNPHHKISFPSTSGGNHDPQVVEVLKRCLVRDPVHRASIEELLNHPYLKAGDGAQTSTDSQQGPKTPSGPNNKNLAQVMSMLATLTPNTRDTLMKNFSTQK